MRTTETEFRTRPWRIHQLARDFELLDVWRLELGSSAGRGIDDFLAALWTAMRSGSRSGLGKLRLWLGKIFGWDDDQGTLPIPGTTERSLAERLDAADRARNRFASDEASPLPEAGAKPIYLFEDEALYEISNDTIHALIHVGWDAEEPSVELAIFIKPRGLTSRLYMAMITPFRHLFVYPTLLREIERLWREGGAARDPGGAVAARGAR